MKSLTIEELEALPIGDWVWVKVLKPDYSSRDYNGEYCRIVPPYTDGLCYGWQGSGGFYKYSDYGSKWLAYKNKEQAEAEDYIATPQMIAEGDCNGFCKDCEGKDVCWKKRR